MNRRRLMGRKVDDSPATLVDGVYEWSGAGGYTSEVVNGLLHIVNNKGQINLPLSKTININTGDSVVFSLIKQSGPKWAQAFFDVNFSGQVIISNALVNVNPSYSYSFTASRNYTVNTINIFKRTGDPPNYSPDFVMAIHITVNGERVL